MNGRHRHRGFSSKYATAVTLAGVLLVVFLVFAPALRFNFTHWDDQFHLTENPFIQSLDWQHLSLIFHSTVLGVYIPLTVLSYAVEYHFFGLDPFVIHLDNLLLHVGVTGLVFIFALRLGWSVRAAALGALLFGLHPLKVESVVWVTERKDVLYAFFYMLALWHYTVYLKSRKWGFYLLTVAWGMLSVLAKPMALSLPLVLLVCDWWDDRKLSRRVLVEKIPYLLFILPVAWRTYALNVEFPRHHLGQQLLVWCWGLAFYVRKFLFPLDLVPVVRLPYPVSLTNPIYPLSLVITAVLFTAWVRGRRDRRVTFAFLFFFASIFFLLRFTDIRGANIVADRFIYLPSLGFCLLFGVLLDRLMSGAEKKKRMIRLLGWGLVLFIVGGLGYLTVRQTGIWKDDFTLWRCVLRHSAREADAYNNLGLAYFYEGQNEQALKNFNKALKIDPGHVTSYNNRALIYLGRKEYPRALEDLNKALSLKPRFAEAITNRGRVFFQMGRFDLALKDLNRALALYPYSALAYYNRGRVYLARNKKKMALLDFTGAVRTDPRMTEAYLNRGAIYLSIKDYDLALKDFNQYLAHKPSSAFALDQRGILYSEQKRYDLALRDFDRVITLDPVNAEGYNNRGNIYYYQKRYDEALRDFDKALELFPGYLQAYNNRGNTHVQKREFGKAIEDFTRALQLNPNMAVLYYHRSVAYANNQQYRSGLFDAQKAQAMGMKGLESYIEKLRGLAGNPE